MISSSIRPSLELAIFVIQEVNTRFHLAVEML